VGEYETHLPHVSPKGQPVGRSAAEPGGSWANHTSSFSPAAFQEEANFQRCLSPCVHVPAFLQPQRRRYRRGEWASEDAAGALGVGSGSDAWGSRWG